MSYLSHSVPDTLKDSPFSERLREQLLKFENCLCIGVDPPLAGLSPFLEGERSKLGHQVFLETFCSHLIETSFDKVPAIKFQSAFFEAFGSAGFAALESAHRKAKELGLLTILDAKRGDIASTMAAYGTMAFEGFKADALTVTPYMGMDVVEPLWPWLTRGKGVYVVWVSSNPSGRLIQESTCELLLHSLDRRFSDEKAKEALGLVLGATRADELSEELFDYARNFPLLMPGVGAQGGKITGRIGTLLREKALILVPQSRSIMNQALHALSWADFRARLLEQITSEAQNLLWT